MVDLLLVALESFEILTKLVILDVLGALALFDIFVCILISVVVVEVTLSPLIAL